MKINNQKHSTNRCWTPLCTNRHK